MTKKEWQLDHLPTAPPETNGSPPPANGTDKLKDSALLSTAPSQLQGTLDIESDQVKLKYPKSVFFIVTNEFCERFTYYGLKTILSLYFVASLGYTEDTATVMYHTFVMLCYFFPLIGAILADTWLGKFKTILYLSIVYSAGSIVLSISSGTLWGSEENRSNLQTTLSLLGLLLIAMGTGGIKPCVSSFGGDQFKIPEQRRQLAQFFSIFYFAINAGSLISTFVTPIFRQDIKCFGQDSCYPLAFGVPAIIMVVSLIVFVAGRPSYKIIPPQGNVLVRVCACIGSALSGRRKRSESSPNKRWIDYADESKYDKELRDDVMIVLKVLVLFLPLPIFWALFDQQGSRWTFQAINMNGRIGSYVIKPDQMQVVNPVLILVFLPIMESVLYPCLTRFHLLRKPLQRMTTGGILACVSFVISAFLEYQLEKTYPVALSEDFAQLRIFNMAPCPLSISSDRLDGFDLNEMDMRAELALKAIDGVPLKLSVKGCVNGDASINLKAKTAQSVYLSGSNGSLKMVEAPTPDTVTRNSDVNPVVRFVYSFLDETEHKIELKKGKVVASTTGRGFDASTEMKGVPVDTYDVLVDGVVVTKGLFLDVSGTYSLLVNKTMVKSVAVKEPSSIHILWQLPQYIVITLGEVMFSVTGLEFAFTQAPVTMKSVLTSAWLLTVAVGNLIVLIIAEAELFKSHVWEFLLFASLMLADMGLFTCMAMRYKYRGESVTEAGSEDATQETTANYQGDRTKQ